MTRVPRAALVLEFLRPENQQTTINATPAFHRPSPAKNAYPQAERWRLDKILEKEG
jgi:hypothetical protein